MKINGSERKLNNRGFSLLELIVTLAVMVVLIGAAIVTVAMLDSSYVEDAERGIKDYIGIARTKSMSVSAKEWYITVAKEGSDYYVYLNKVVASGVDGADQETIMVDKKRIGTNISITYGVSKEPITDTKKLEFHFDAATGKIVVVKYNNSDQGTGDGIGYIGISRNDYEVNLKVFYNTGKCERE